jgi:ribosomal protein L1
VSNTPFKIDRRAGIMHVRVGLLNSFNPDQLDQNIRSVFDTVSPYGKTLKKGKFIESAHLVVPSEKSIRIEPPST